MNIHHVIFIGLGFVWFKSCTPLDLSQCIAPLGMESGAIKDDDITASSSFDSSNVGPQHGRVRTELHGGAWCPKEPTTTDPKEWLEINLHTVHVITATGTQGRFGNGQGKEFSEAYILEYWRPKIGKWVRYRDVNGTEVSWIRKRDLHILTAGILTYTSDQRFQVNRPDKSENWTLQIKFPQLRDAGIYECQVNTEPKMSLAFRLNVIEAKARIKGPTDLYVKTGSSVSLTCIISQGPHDLGTVFWYKDKSIIQVQHPHPNEYDSVPRIVIENEWTDGLTSVLRISHAQLSDSGNYTCVPTIAAAASVNVHVISGEHPAAMQHGNKNTASVVISLHSTVYSLIVFFLKRLR